MREKHFMAELAFRAFALYIGLAIAQQTGMIAFIHNMISTSATLDSSLITNLAASAPNISPVVGG